MDCAGLRIGVAMCGSYCTFEETIQQIRKLVEHGADVLPIMSENAVGYDTRFGTSKYFMRLLERITGKEIICTLCEAEKVGPQDMADIILVMPCTGNTLAKLANGITDTAVLMAVKGLMRNNKPICIAISTNDALGLNLENIGKLLNIKNIYFVPFNQDNHESKPKSMTANIELVIPTIEKAIKKEQIQPIINCS